MRNLRNNWFVTIVVLLSLIGLLFLSGDNLGKAIVIFCFFVAWAIFAFRTRNLVFSSFVMLVAVFPFNITYQLSFLSGQFNPYIDGVLVNYLVPTVHIVDVMAGLIVVSFVWEGGIRKFAKYKWWVISVILYLLLHNIIFANWVTFILSLRYLLLIIVGFALVLYLKEAFEKGVLRALINQLVFVVSIGLIVQIAIGLLQVINGHSIGMDFLGESRITGSYIGVSYLSLDGGNVLRAYGTFPHPNVLGGYFVAVQLFFLTFLPFVRKKWKVVFSTLAVLSTTGVLLTFSRTAVIISLIVWASFAILMLMNSKRIVGKLRSSRNRLASIGIIVPWYQRIIDLFSGASVSAMERIELLNVAMAIISSNFFVGVGIGNFIRKMGSSAPINSSGITVFEPVHNIFALFTAENGIAVFFIVVVIVSFAILRALKVSDLANKVIIVLSSICVIIAGMFDHYLLSFAQGNMLLLVYAIFIVVIACGQRNSKKLFL